MTFRAEPPLLYLGGAVVATDWAAWQEAMTEFGSRIDTVVMHQSGGGDSTAGRRIGNDIRKRGLKTVVFGRCSSACANMFLAGVTRQFATPQGRVRGELGFHGSYNKTTKAVNQKRTAEYFVNMSDGKMDEAFVERFIRLANKRGLMRFIHREQRAYEKEPLAMLCKGDELAAKRESQCEHLTDINALDKGVVTTWEARDIGTPHKPSTDKVTLKLWNASSHNKKTSVTKNLPPEQP
jgi:hypothetical protein